MAEETNEVIDIYRTKKDSKKYSQLSNTIKEAIHVTLMMIQG